MPVYIIQVAGGRAGWGGGGGGSENLAFSQKMWQKIWHFHKKWGILGKIQHFCHIFEKLFLKIALKSDFLM